MIEACLFDIGNVLVSFDYARTFGPIAARTSRTYDEIRRHMAQACPALETGRLSSEAFVAAAIEFIGGGVSSDDFLTAYTGIFDPILPVWQLVEAIRESVPVYLFSNTSEIHETCLFRQFPEFSRFHGGYFSWRLGCMKPDAGIYEHACASLGLPPQSIAYVDDLAPNIEAGRRFGFRCHRYERTHHGELLEFFRQYGLASGGPAPRGAATATPP
jgi:FMN phosphatase YigB (HAD superfamily)